MTGVFDIAGKVALITGGAQGLGRMIAEAYVRAGVHIFITSRKADICAQAASEMSAHGSCDAIAADMSTVEETEQLARTVAEKTDRLHILVNNAGKTWGASLDSFPAKAWPSVMAVNVQMPFTLIQHLLPLLQHSATAEDPTRIINIGSVAGKVVEPLSAFSYAASKAGLHHLSRTLAAELAPRHIAVNVVVPGYFPTQMTAPIRGDAEKLHATVAHIPLGRLGSAEDIGGVCVFLASRASAYITGAELVVDGGLSGCR